MLRDVPEGAAATRAKHWAKKLDLSKAAKTQADRLYLGPHWSASKGAFDAALEAGIDAQMYVVSAGYGLYPVDALVTSYAATFVPGHADSVSPPDLDRADRTAYLSSWWTSLGEHLPLPNVKVRTFAQLAKTRPQSRILVVAGGHYLDAIFEDLLEARGRLASPDYLAVISAGASPATRKRLGSSLLPVDARFENLLNGARTALNARVAQWLLHGVVNPSAIGADYFRRKLEEKAKALPPIRTFDRKPQEEWQVTQWIHNNLSRPEGASASAMLRYLRESGLACEQKRFGRIYNKAVRSKPRGT
jgi:hypothetical protein